MLILRPQDFDTSQKVWVAVPHTHKTAYRGRKRKLYFGSVAQTVLKTFMVRPANSYLFSPKEAEAERYAKAEMHRIKTDQPSPRKTDRRLGERYTRDSYRRAIKRACSEADVTPWSPHQLRHNAATTIREKFGVEAAQVMLGHARVDVTEIYAQVTEAKAFEVAGQMG